MTVGDHRRNGDQDPEACVVKRDGDASCELGWVRSVRSVGSEDFYHPDDSPKQTEQRGDGRDHQLSARDISYQEFNEPPTT